MKMNLKKTCLLPAFILFLALLLPIHANAASISKKNVTLKVGQTTTLKVKGTKKKAVWKSTNNKIATVNKKGTVKAKKAGTCKVYAKIGKKTYKCTVKVIKPSPIAGSRQKPLSAYQTYTTKIYDYWNYLGKFKIQLLDSMYGKEAADYVMQNPYNQQPTSSQEYIYLKFKITYISGSKEIRATDVINHYSNIFNKNASKSINNIDWGYLENGVEDIVDVNLYPGGSAVCQKAILIQKGNTPITYRLQTGYKNDSPQYTWFKTW